MESSEWKEKKNFIEELKRQWKLLWVERIDDKVRAEGIASDNFALLFVDRGTVILATRDFKPLEFREVLQQHELVSEESKVFPDPAVGGWGKFAREAFGKNRSNRRRLFAKPRPSNGPPKKGGRGWLHTRL